MSGERDAPAAAEEPQEAPVIEDSFEPDTLFSLLSAEIAGQRKRYDISLLNYVRQAKKTKDLGVIRRAFDIADFLKARNALFELSKVWHEVEPEAVVPHRVMALQYIQAQKFPEALKQLEQIEALGQDPAYQSLALYSAELNDEEKRALLQLLIDLAEERPVDTGVAHGIAMMHRSLADLEASLAQADHTLALSSGFQPAVFLKGSLLFDLGRTDDALRFLEKNTRRFPNNRQLGTLYARLLIDSNNLQRAEEEYRKLSKRFPTASNLVLAHALVALELDNLETAKAELQKLVELGQHTNAANFYLGRIADKTGDSTEAITRYSQIRGGAHYYDALTRAGYLRSERGELEEVLGELADARRRSPDKASSYWQVETRLLGDLKEKARALNSVNVALEKFPDDTRLLYLRAMLRDSEVDLPLIERDFRRILELEPKNSQVLNAFGYTLADKTDRYYEAFELIEQAKSLDPNSPAITDSLGWVYYRMGKVELALEYLEQAYEKFPDPEVAAHLGEVLWELGREKEAITVWRKAHDEQPNHKVLTETLKRYQIIFD